jgi:AraC-like DNA-binding protein
VGYNQAMADHLIHHLLHLGDTPYHELVDGLALFRQTLPTTFDAVVYEPLICLILQGEKEIHIGDQRAVVGAGQALVVSHATPVVSRVTRASCDAPYLSLIATLDLTELRSLYAELGPAPEDIAASAVAVADVDRATLDVLGRYVALADDPDDARVMLPLVRRELHYRLLRSDSGAMLRRLLRRDSHASNITRAIQLLRDDFRHRLDMADVAQAVGMSPSSFYKHFRAITSTTPLQFQKDLRLTEARRLLLGGDHTVSTAAFAVGYESPSQFSREYSRKFGGPPRVDLMPVAAG